MNLTELKAKLNELVAEAKAIEAKGDDVTTEDVARFEQVLSEAETVKEQIKALETSSTVSKDRLASLESAITAPTKPRVLGNGVEVGKYLPEEDPKRGFHTAGDFFSAVQKSSMPGSRYFDKRLETLGAATGLTHGEGADGAWLLPPEFSTQIHESVMGEEDLLGQTDSYSISGESIEFPAEAETTHANAVVGGGVRAYWLDTKEAAVMTASQPKFRKVKLEPHTLAVLVYATDKLLQSPISLESYITKKAGKAIGLKVADSIINGDGAGQPLGILKSGALLSVAKQSGQGAATIKSENIIKMYGRLHPAFRAGAKWYCNTDLQEQLPQMVINVGTGGTVTYMPAGGLSGAPYATLMGLPIQYTECCQALGTKGDIILGNMKAYVTALRGAIQSAMSIHVRFLYNETAFRFLFDVDGQTWDNSALTPMHGTNTLSSFVTLDARA